MKLRTALFLSSQTSASLHVAFNLCQGYEICARYLDTEEAPQWTNLLGQIGYSRWQVTVARLQREQIPHPRYEVIQAYSEASVAEPHVTEYFIDLDQLQNYLEGWDVLNEEGWTPVENGETNISTEEE